MPLDKLFPAQEKSEKIIKVIRKHWFSYMIFWIVAVLMSIPLIVAGSYWAIHQNDLPSVFFNLVAIFAPVDLLLIFGLMIYGFVDLYLDVYIITDHRIVDITQNGFFKREISEVNLRMIQDVKAEVDGVFPTLLHFGNVYIQTAGEIRNFFFSSIPHPYEISKKILDLHEAYVKDKMEEDDGLDEESFDDKSFRQEKSQPLYNTSKEKNNANKTEVLKEDATSTEGGSSEIDHHEEVSLGRQNKPQTEQEKEDTNKDMSEEEGEMQEGEEIDL